MDSRFHKKIIKSFYANFHAFEFQDGYFTFVDEDLREEIFVAHAEEIMESYIEDMY